MSMNLMFSGHYFFQYPAQITLCTTALHHKGLFVLKRKLTLTLENSLLQSMIGPAILIRVVEPNCTPCDALNSQQDDLARSAYLWVPYEKFQLGFYFCSVQCGVVRMNTEATMDALAFQYIKCELSHKKLRVAEACYAPFVRVRELNRNVVAKKFSTKSARVKFTGRCPSRRRMTLF